jgi:hypothetical protein
MRKLILAAATTMVVTMGTAMGTASAQAAGESASAMACGLHQAGSDALYTNCSAANEWIFVTYLLGGNTYFCVAPNETKRVGNWSNVFRVYNRGGC